jgi:hypothetical protein
VIARALAKEPTDRFASAKELAAAARAAMDDPTGAGPTAVLAGAAVPVADSNAPTAIARPAGAAEAGRPSRRRPPVAALAAATLLAAAGISAALAFTPDGTSPSDGGAEPAPTRSVQNSNQPSPGGPAGGQPGSGNRPVGSPKPAASSGGAATAPGGSPVPSAGATASAQPGAPATSPPAAGPTAGASATPEPGTATSAPAPSPSGGGDGTGGGALPPDGQSPAPTPQPTGSPVL